MPKAAIVGGGVIGGGWAARFLLMGWDVSVFDPDPEAERKIGEVLDNARRALPGLVDVRMPSAGRLQYVGKLSACVADADWIQESVPERLDLKRKVFQTIQEHCRADAVIGSSTSGFKPSELQDCATRPEQILVTHPFNPVYLLPVVEVVGSDRTPGAVRDRACEVLREIGMAPVVIGREIDAHVADRLMEAMWREALWLVHDGVATTAEIDDIIRLGFGLRWAQMGVFETFRVAGGEAGMRHFMAQFGPALKWPWTKLMDVPEMDDALIDKIAGQSDEQAAGRSVRELERIRDTNLVAIMRALKWQGWGVGALLKDQENRVAAATGAVRRFEDVADLSRPVITLEMTVPLDWTDYNGHMTEAKYLQAFGDATDRFMQVVGCDADYVAAGGSFFTAESHIRHLAEAQAGAPLRIETQCLGGAGKKMHLFHTMWSGDEALATGEHMLIHVDMATRRAAPPGPEVARKLGAIAAAHAALPMPEGAGRAVGAPR